MSDRKESQRDPRAKVCSPASAIAQLTLLVTLRRGCIGRNITHRSTSPAPHRSPQIAARDGRWRPIQTLLYWEGGHRSLEASWDSSAKCHCKFFECEQNRRSCERLANTCIMSSGPEDGT